MSQQQKVVSCKYNFDDMFTGISPVPSDAPRNFNVTTNGSTTLILKWLPPSTRNGMIRSYRITILDQTNSTILYFNTTELEFTINNLHSFTRYTCNVSAYTVAAGPAASVTIMTPESGKYLIIV